MRRSKRRARCKAKRAVKRAWKLKMDALRAMVDAQFHEGRLLDGQAARFVELLRLPPVKVVMDPVAPGDDSGVMRGTLLIPPEHFIGRTAGEMRARGFKQDPKIPDSAVLRRMEDGTIGFDYVSVDIVMTPDGAKIIKWLD